MWEIDLLGAGTVYCGDEVIAGRVCEIRSLDVVALVSHTLISMSSTGTCL